MKKFKLFTLSLLTLSAVGVLASCGAKQPSQKPDVYFRANSRVIEKNGKTKAVDFKDEECATIEVKDKDNLKYGQDVEITIKPKSPFFTFREYDPEDPDWKPTGAGPVRPYVGLGNPYSLYNYPLQEDLAWKFEDKTVESQDKPGYYKEEYKITVFGDFFQKNIVIDYGNVNVNNSIYAYTSSIYNEVFSDVSSLASSFGCDASGKNNFYVLDKGYSAFTAAGKGVTVTYTFAQDNLFNFNGWDTETSQVSNANGVLKYDHFEINGIDKAGNVTPLARKDESLREEEQSFLVDVSGDGKYISFFIRWSALANPDSEYSTKYDKIEVKLDEPKCDYMCELALDSDGITEFKGGFFQYPSSLPNDKKPITDDRVFETYNVNTETAYKFTNVLDIEDLGESHVQYGVAFQLPENKNKLFSIYVNDSQSPLFDINLDGSCTPATQTTGWRETSPEISNANSLVEKNLNYWVTDNGWHLVQLNPQDRTFGFYDASGQPIDTFNGKENLYYLYTTDVSALTASGDKASIFHIKLNEPPVQVGFTLADDGTTRTFGSFDESSDVYETTRSVSDSDVVIPFYPESGYINSEFNVGLNDTSVFERASYEKDPSSPFGLIKLFRKEGKIDADYTVTITLTIPDTYVTFVGQTSTLGGFVAANGDLLADTHDLTDDEKKSIDENKLIFRFKFNSDYASRVIPGGKELSSDLTYAVSYKGYALDSGVSVGLDLDIPTNDTIMITVELSDKPDVKGAKFGISLSFMSIESASKDPEIKFELDTTTAGHLGDYVGKNAPIEIKLTFLSKPLENPKFVAYPFGGPAVNITSVPVVEQPAEFKLTLELDSSQDTYRNGMKIGIGVAI